ncbi:linamarin synthase 1 [Cryptomeria japonica]|uniref:linamarin synthase 1 n=1 Tax=Cryptomeria japonica TaxID=3369 RepID=UPI0027DA0287|nr:linamarin synthase 1 [Cryptomeria japonica]
MTMNGVKDLAVHAVLVPFPAQGHVNALIHFADLLAARGVFITFVNTEWTEKRMFGSAKHKSQLHHSKPNFRFLSFPDGLPPEHGRTSQLGELFTTVARRGPALEALLRTQSGNGVPPVTCILADCCMSCTASVAANMRVPRVVFWPFCAAASIAQKYANSLLSQGHIPVKVSEGNRPDKMITTLPGNIPALRPSDLISFYREQFTSDPIYEALLFESRMCETGDYVLVNTFEELEGRDAAPALSIKGCPSLSIGPVFLPNFLGGKNSTLSNMSMWEEDDSCLHWLDKQRPHSVLYVSFGSLALKSQEQLDEVALGLEQSGHAFLWVLRSDIAQGQAAVLPEGLEQRTKDRALFVKWTPQLKVLAHPSVGGFLTHSGWNSTVESIGMGVPMIGWPYFGDQFLDCRFAKDIWKVGLDFKDVDVDDARLVRREEIKSAVVRVMESEELQKKAQELKEAATKAVMVGGSSFNNITTFIHDMLEHAKSQSKSSSVYCEETREKDDNMH